MLDILTFNIANSPIRRERLHGKDYIVAPTAMLTEGVHNGSQGPLLYREDECKKAVQAWNMKPIVVYHPQINGQGVSACDPVILENQQVGMLMNTGWRSKLRTEAWIEESRAAKVDDRVITALEENKPMEVSTGLFVDPGGGPGEWNGVAYNAEAVNHRPDHLALLPDKIGACSIADGAGMLQLNEAATAQGLDVTRLLVRQMDTLRRMVGNAMSHSNTHSAIMRALKEKVGENAWIIDVYDNFFIYDVDGKPDIFRLYYSKSKDGIEIMGEPEPVVRVAEYRTKEGKFVGNEKAMRTDGGMEYPAAAYAYVPDPEKPSTWKLRLWETPEKKETAAQVGRAVAALGKGFRGQKVQLPADARNGVKAKIRAAWKRVNPNKKEAEMPKVLMNERSKTMKDKLIDALIANEKTQWTEDDREILNEVSEEALEKMAPVEGEGSEGGEGEGEGAGAGASEGSVENAAPITMQSYLAAAPPELRGVLTNALAVHNEQKNAVINKITANKSNQFTKEFLATKDLAELQGMAALMVGNEAPSAPVPMFQGAATPVVGPTMNEHTEGPLLPPVMNFEKEAAAV